MKYKFHPSVNQLYEVSLLAYKAFHYEDGERISMIRKHEQFILSEQEINTEFKDVYEFYSCCLHEARKQVSSFPRIAFLFDLPGQTENHPFILELVSMFNQEDLNAYSLPAFLSGAKFTLYNAAESHGLPDDDFDSHMIEEITDPSLDFPAILTQIQSLPEQYGDRDRLQLIDFFQNIETYYRDFSALTNVLWTIYKKHLHLVQPRISSLYTSLSDTPEQFTEKLLFRFFEGDDFKKSYEGTLHIYVSVMIVYGIVLRILGDLLDADSMQIGLLYQPISTYIDQKTEDTRTTHEQLKALGDQTRFQIIAILDQQPQYTKQLADQLDLTSATVSHHLSILTQAELVKIHFSGRKAVYSLNHESFAKLALEMNAFAKENSYEA